MSLTGRLGKGVGIRHIWGWGYLTWGTSHVKCLPGPWLPVLVVRGRWRCAGEECSWYNSAVAGHSNHVPGAGGGSPWTVNHYILYL